MTADDRRRVECEAAIEVSGGVNWKERTKNEETGYQDDQGVDFLIHGSCYGPWSNGSQQEPFCPTLTPEVTLQFLKTFLVADATAPGG